jgi:ankyrin repeat protein
MSSQALSLDALSIEEALHAAAKTGDVDALIQLLNDDAAAVDEENEDSETPLFVACEHGRVDAARLLLKKGAAVDRAEKYGSTPLFAACVSGHVGAARLLLDNGADVHKASNKNRTPLHAASYEGHIDVVRLLLANGAAADIDSMDEEFDTPLADAKAAENEEIVALLEEHLKSIFALHAAARTGDVDAMTQLLDGDAEVDAKKDGTTPLFVACEHGRVDAAGLLLDKGADVNQAKMNGVTPLHVACREGHIDLARLLLEKGAEVDRADEDGATPLFVACEHGLVACEHGHVDVVRLLLERGAKIERVSWTPLLVACFLGDVEAVGRHLDSGAELDRADDKGRAPLLVACWKGHVGAARLCLDRDAQVDQAMKDGRAALYVACQEGHVDAARLLLDEGAEVDQAAKDGATPLYIACEKGHVDAAGLLLDNGADVDWGHGGNYDRTPLYIACEKGHDTIVELLLSKQSLVDEGAVNGDYYIGPEWETKEKTLLHTACDNGHYKVVQVLLDKGAEIRGSSNGGEHPLVAACRSGNKDIVSLLLEKGAEVETTSMSSYGYGDTTLLYTASACGHANVVALLLERRADVNKGMSYTRSYEACDGSSYSHKTTITPLYAACEMQHYHETLYTEDEDRKVTAGYVEVVKLLLQAGADMRMGEFRGEYSVATCHGTPLEEAEKQVQDDLDEDRRRTTAWKEAIAKIVKLLRAKMNKEKRAAAAAIRDESVRVATEKYKSELTSVWAVERLTGKAAGDALSEMKVKGRANLDREGKYNLLIKHLELTEEMNEEMN